MCQQLIVSFFILSAGLIKANSSCLFDKWAPPPSPPCTRSRMEQLLWHLPGRLAGCGPRSLMVTLHFWYSLEFRQDGKWSCTEQVPVFPLLFHYCFSSESCRHLLKAECYPVSRVPVCGKVGRGKWDTELVRTRPLQSQPCSSISVCSERTWSSVAKNSTRRFFLLPNIALNCMFSAGRAL